MSIPNVTGESTVTGFSGKILLKGAAVAFGRPNDPITGLPTGKPVPQGVNITKRVDSSTGFFGNAAATLRFFSEPTYIAFTQIIDSREFEILRWTFAGVRVVAHGITGHSGGEDPEEQITLAFANVTVKSTIKNADGSVTSKSFTFKLG